MAHTQNPRRFYIDHADDRPIVRTVPVRYATTVTAPETAATHQVSAPEPRNTPARIFAPRTRRAPASVSRLVQSVRRSAHTSHS